VPRVSTKMVGIVSGEGPTNLIGRRIPYRTSRLTFLSHDGERERERECEEGGEREGGNVVRERAFTGTIKYRFRVRAALMPKNTYGNSINAQHVAPQIEERDILAGGTVVFLFSRIFSDATRGYKIRGTAASRS